MERNKKQRQVEERKAAQVGVYVCMIVPVLRG